MGAMNVQVALKAMEQEMTIKEKSCKIEKMTQKLNLLETGKEQQSQKGD